MERAAQAATVLSFKINPLWTWCVLKVCLWQIDIANQRRWKEKSQSIDNWGAKRSAGCCFLAPNSIEWEQKERQGGLFPITQPLFTTKLKRCFAVLLLNRLSHDALSQCKVIVHSWRQHNHYSCWSLGVNHRHFRHQKHQSASIFNHFAYILLCSLFKEMLFLGSYWNHHFQSIMQKWTVNPLSF